MIFELILELVNPESEFWEYYIHVQDQFIMKIVDIFW